MKSILLAFLLLIQILVTTHCSNSDLENDLSSQEINSSTFDINITGSLDTSQENTLLEKILLEYEVLSKDEVNLKDGIISPIGIPRPDITNYFKFNKQNTSVDRAIFIITTNDELTQTKIESNLFMANDLKNITSFSLIENQTGEFNLKSSFYSTNSKFKIFILFPFYDFTKDLFNENLKSSKFETEKKELGFAIALYENSQSNLTLASVEPEIDLGKLSLNENELGQIIATASNSINNKTDNNTAEENQNTDNSEFQSLIENSLVYYLKFDELAGNIVKDYSLNNFDASVSGGSSSWDENKGLYFDGSSYYLEASYNNNITYPIQNEFSMLVWFSFDEIEGLHYSNLPIFSLTNSIAIVLTYNEESLDYGLRSKVRYENDLEISTDNLVGSLTPNTDYLVALTLSDGELSIFINETLESNQICQACRAYKINSDESNVAYWGKHNDIANYFSGIIKEFRLYSEVLNEAEINTYYQDIVNNN
ncbi:MAG: LamG-like jellyroll fold domain-containing protein [Pseudomonadota bacterium]